MPGALSRFAMFFFIELSLSLSAISEISDDPLFLRKATRRFHRDESFPAVSERERDAHSRFRSHGGLQSPRSISSRSATHRTGARDIILPRGGETTALIRCATRRRRDRRRSSHLAPPSTRLGKKRARERERKGARSPWHTVQRRVGNWPVAGVNESNGPPPRAPLRFALFLLRAPESTPESPTPRNPVVSLDLPPPPASSCRNSPLSPPSGSD